MRKADAAIVLGLFVFLWGAQAACTDGSQPSGAKYRICMPSGIWNRELVVYAHGYVSPDQPIAIPEEQLSLPDGTSLPNAFTALGYAFAVSSYRSNGLAILDGQADLVELTEVFKKKFGIPSSTYLGGVSEGGLVATLSAEKFPGTYNAAIAACGPIGSFVGQINYLGDARALFDYYFPGVLPGTVVNVPSQVFSNWQTVYVPAIQNALAANPVNRQNFINASLIPTSTDPAVTLDNILAVLNYSGMATNDAKTKLKGQPFDNRFRLYFGTTNDFEVNARIPRYAADSRAVESMKLYETSGKPQMPLVTLHTTADPVIPFLHEVGYNLKFQQNKGRGLAQLPVFRNGHCNFQAGDIIWAFLVMLAQKQGASPAAVVHSMSEAQQQALPLEIRKAVASH